MHGARTALVLLVLGLLAGGCRTAPRETLAEREFRDLIDGCFAAWSALGGRPAETPEDVARFYAKDRRAVFFGVSSVQATGWAAYRSAVAGPFPEGMAGGTFVPGDDLQVTRRGGVAWTSVTLHVSAPLPDGRSLERDGRHTAIWEKRGGRWAIVHEHLSLTPEQDDPAPPTRR